jgi:hypothetical protein
MNGFEEIRSRLQPLKPVPPILPSFLSKRGAPLPMNRSGWLTLGLTLLTFRLADFFA